MQTSKQQKEEKSRTYLETAPSPGEAVIIELDEMWHYLHSKKTNFGYGKLIVVIPVNSSTGNVAIVTRALLHDC